MKEGLLIWSYLGFAFFAFVITLLSLSFLVPKIATEKNEKKKNKLLTLFKAIAVTLPIMLILFLKFGQSLLSLAIVAGAFSIWGIIFVLLLPITGLFIIPWLVKTVTGYVKFYKEMAEIVSEKEKTKVDNA